MLRFLRKYEKILFWMLIIFVLPGLGISGAILWFFQRPTIKPAGKLFGRDISRLDFERERNRLTKFWAYLHGARGIRPEAVWSFITFLGQAERAGIEISDKELSDKIIDVYKERVALREIWPTLMKIRDRRKRLVQYYTLLAEAKKKVRFDPKQYREELRKSGLSIPEFEHVLKDQLKIEKLRELVRESGKVPVAKLYERYQEENHKRKIACIAFEADRFVLDPAKVSREEIEAFYEKNPEQFRLPKRAKIEYVLADLEKVKKRLSLPKKAEIEDYYEKHKAEFRIAPGEEAKPGEKEKPGEKPGDKEKPGEKEKEKKAEEKKGSPEYKPLEAVRAEIVDRILSDRAREKAGKTVEKLRGELAETLKKKKPLDLESAAALAGVEYGKTELLPYWDILKNQAVSDFKTLAALDSLKIGGLSHVIEGPRGPFLVRLLERTEARIPPLAEIEDKVREAYAGVPDEELQAYYRDHKYTYREPEKLRLEYIIARHADFAKHVAEPKDEDPGDEPNPLGRNVTEKFQEAIPQGLMVFADGGAFSVVEAGEPTVPLHKNPLHKKQVKEFIKKHLEG